MVKVTAVRVGIGLQPCDNPADGTRGAVESSAESSALCGGSGTPDRTTDFPGEASLVRFPRPRPAGALLTFALVVPTAVIAPSFNAPRRSRIRCSTTPAGGTVRRRCRGARLRSSARLSCRMRGVRHRPHRRWVAASAQRTPRVFTGQLTPMAIGCSASRGEALRLPTIVPLLVNARTHTDGTWTDWFEVPAMVDIGTEPSPNGRFGTEPYWVGDSDGRTGARRHRRWRRARPMYGQT